MSNKHPRQYLLEQLPTPGQAYEWLLVWSWSWLTLFHLVIFKCLNWIWKL